MPRNASLHSPARSIAVDALTVAKRNSLFPRSYAWLPIDHWEMHLARTPAVLALLNPSIESIRHDPWPVLGLALIGPYAALSFQIEMKPGKRGQTHFGSAAQWGDPAHDLKVRRQHNWSPWPVYLMWPCLAFAIVLRVLGMFPRQDSLCLFASLRSLWPSAFVTAGLVPRTGAGSGCSNSPRPRPKFVSYVSLLRVKEFHLP